VISVDARTMTSKYLGALNDGLEAMETPDGLVVWVPAYYSDNDGVVLSGRASAFAFFEAVGAGATERQQGKEDKAKGVFVFHGLFVPFCFCFVRMGLGLCAFIFRLSPRCFRTAFPSLPRCAGEGIFSG